MKRLLVGVLMLSGCASEPKKTETPAAPAPAKILQFYAAPATIGKGGKALLCYGVEGAASVRLEPAVEEINPSRARCIEVAPAASTSYTLFAKSKAGEEVSQKVDLTVDPKLKGMAGAAEAPARPAGSLIQFFSALSPKVAKGGTATLCYGVKGADKVSLTPAVTMVVPSEKICFQVKPEATTDYTLTATSASGGSDAVTVRVAVQ